jgi:hypothetical protein
MTSIISKLKSRGLITNVIGSTPSKIRPALAVWARKEPKDVFLAFVALSEAITNEPLAVFVDDLCSQLVMERTQNDQAKMNERYREFFEVAGCVVKFSSEIYANEFSAGVFPLLIELGRHVPVNEFKRCLPEDKRRGFNKLTLDEILHLLLELSLLERVAKECNLLLVGHFSQAIVVCHRKTSQNPISAIAVPRLNSREEIDGYKRKIVTP